MNMSIFPNFFSVFFKLSCISLKFVTSTFCDEQFSELIKDDVFVVLKLEGSVSARNHVGGTSPTQVKTQIARVKKKI